MKCFPRKTENDISEGQPNNPQRQFNIENLVDIASQFRSHVALIGDAAGTSLTEANRRAVRYLTLRLKSFYFVPSIKYQVRPTNRGTLRLQAARKYMNKKRWIAHAIYFRHTISSIYYERGLSRSGRSTFTQLNLFAGLSFKPYQ